MYDDPNPDSPLVKLTIDGTVYKLRPAELNAWQTATFEAECGLPVELLVARLGADSVTLSDVARFVYLCAMQGGQDPTSFRAVAERLTYRADVSDVSIEGIEEPTPDGVEPDDRPPGLDPDDGAEELAERRAELDEELATAGPEPVDPTSATGGSRDAAGSF